MDQLDKFLKKLHQNLYFFSEEEIEQILMDYKELYNDKIQMGISEEEVIKSFDTPKQIAKNYSQELEIKTSFLKKMYVNTIKSIDKSLDKVIKGVDKSINKYKDIYNTKKQAKKQVNINNEYINKQTSNEENSNKQTNNQENSNKQTSNEEEGFTSDELIGNNMANNNLKYKPKLSQSIIGMIGMIGTGIKKIIMILFKIFINLIIILIISSLILSLIAILIIYIFSFIFIEIKVNELSIRILETSIVISYTVCSLLFIKFLSGVFRE